MVRSRPWRAAIKLPVQNQAVSSLKSFKSPAAPLNLFREETLASPQKCLSLRATRAWDRHCIVLRTRYGRNWICLDAALTNPGPYFYRSATLTGEPVCGAAGEMVLFFATTIGGGHHVGPNPLYDSRCVAKFTYRNSLRDRHGAA